MMKKFLLSSCLAFAFYGANAQTPITLNENNVPFSRRDVNVSVISAAQLTEPATGANQTWDYSNVDTLGSDIYYYYNSTNGQFTSTAINEDVSEPITKDRYISLYNYLDKNNNGIIWPGFSADYQVYPIGDLTNNPNDSFYVLEQTQVYAQPQYTLRFPVTENSSWAANTRRVINFQITLSNFMMNKMPGSKVTNFNRKDTVTGWGRLRVPVENSKSVWYDVLMVRRVVKRIDSLYLNGAPAPAPLLAAFGLTQGDNADEYRTYFYRANDFFPLMFINHGEDASYSSAIFAMYNTDNLTVTGLKETGSAVSAALYPNPLTGNNLQVSFLKDENAAWKINVLNMLGQAVQSQHVNAGAGNVNATVNVSNAVANGVYLVQLVDANGIVRGTSKVIVKR